VYLIQVLLPIRGRSGTVDGTAFARTREELVDAFDGVTAYARAPAQGVWVAPDGDRERDDVVMVEVLATDFDRPWWRVYRQKLAERFDQDEVHIRAVPAEVP
jgi:hypothetical protein